MVFHCVVFLSRYDFTAFVSVFVIIMLKMTWLPIRCFPYSVTWGSTYVSVSINSDNISKTTGWCAAAPHDRASTVLYRWLYTLTVLPLSIMAMNSLNQQFISNLDSSLHRNRCHRFSVHFLRNSASLYLVCFPSLWMAFWQPSFHREHFWWGFSEQ